MDLLGLEKRCFSKKHLNSIEVEILIFDWRGSTTIRTNVKFGPNAGFGPKTNSDQKFLNSAQNIPVINLIT